MKFQIIVAIALVASVVGASIEHQESAAEIVAETAAAIETAAEQDAFALPENYAAAAAKTEEQPPALDLSQQLKQISDIIAKAEHIDKLLAKAEKIERILQKTERIRALSGQYDNDNDYDNGYQSKYDQKDYYDLTRYEQPKEKESKFDRFSRKSLFSKRRDYDDDDFDADRYFRDGDDSYENDSYENDDLSVSRVSKYIENIVDKKLGKKLGGKKFKSGRGRRGDYY